MSRRFIGMHVTTGILRDATEIEMQRLRRFFLQTRSGRLFFGVVTAGAIAAVATVALGGSRRSSRLALSTSSQEGCTSGAADAEVRVTIYGGGEAPCVAFDMGAARRSEAVWHIVPAAAEEAGRELVCSMTKDGLVLEVRDTTGLSFGKKICAQITTQGWQKQEGPGSAIEQERKAREAEAKATSEQREATERAEPQRRQAARERKRQAEAHAEQAKEAARTHGEQVQRHQEETQHEREGREHQEQDAERAAEYVQ